MYVDQILEPYVGRWLEEGQNFVLEEDNDSGHGGCSSQNIIHAWKQEHELQSFFNAPYSPDLAPIENA